MGNKKTVARNKGISSSPKRFLQYLLWQSKSKRIAQGYEYTLTIDEVLDVYNKQQGLCAVSGVKMTHLKGQGHLHKNMSIDRIDNNKGYTQDNVHIVCYYINMMRRTMNLDEFKDVCKEIATFTLLRNYCSIDELKKRSISEWWRIQPVINVTVDTKK